MLRNVPRTEYRLRVVGLSRATIVLTVCVLFAAGLSSCTASRSGVSPAVVSYSKGLPPTVTFTPTDARKPLAAWAGDHRIFVVAWGSGSCPPLPETVRADGPHQLTIKTKEHRARRDNACTSDLAATTSTVDLPNGIDTTTPLRVEVDGTVTVLAPR